MQWNSLPMVKPDRVQVFGQHSQAHGVASGEGAVQGQELDSVTFWSAFHSTQYIL